MKIYLLTHEREYQRPTNTGSLAVGDSCSIVERILWQRVSPCQDLVKLIESGNALLLYSDKKETSFEGSMPNDEIEGGVEPLLARASITPCIDDFDNIIIIDGTWQEAQKIFNKSPYLQKAPRFTLDIERDSSYRLRRNQRAGGLCTIECIIELLKLKCLVELASHLEFKFKLFNGDV